MKAAAANAFEVFDTFLGWQKSNQGFRDALLVGIAATLVTLAIVAWAVFVRKRKRRPGYTPPSPKAVQESADTAKRRKWRRRRKDHRPRNPTLAETGGLPPVKPPSHREPLD